MDNSAVDQDGELLLQKQVHRFVLTGHKDPTMRQINGGRMCVDAWGKQPSRYTSSKSISLDSCGLYASSDASIIGFKWGAKAFSADVYREYAQPVAEGQAPSFHVDLHRLFDNQTKFSCTVFVDNSKEDGKPLKLAATPLRTHLGFDDAEASRGAGVHVCRQRWTLLRLLFYTDVGEMYFCFMPQSDWHLCQERFEQFQVMGKIFYLVLFFFLLFLAYVMRHIVSFSVSLTWLVRVVCCAELAILSINYMLDNGHDKMDSPFVFFLKTVGMTFIGLNVLLVPKYVCDYLFHRASFLGISWLLVLVLQPTAILEWITYDPQFPFIVDKKPCLVMTLAFLLECGRRALVEKLGPAADGSPALEHGWEANDYSKISSLS